jgi:hypothetical protein
LLFNYIYFKIGGVCFFFFFFFFFLSYFACYFAVSYSPYSLLLKNLYILNEYHCILKLHHCYGYQWLMSRSQVKRKQLHLIGKQYQISINKQTNKHVNTQINKTKISLFVYHDELQDGSMMKYCIKSTW